MTEYTFAWEIKDPLSPNAVLSGGSVNMTPTDPFLFGLRAAFATLKFGHIAFALKEYVNNTVELQYGIANPTNEDVSVAGLEGPALLDAYLNAFVVAEDEFTDKFVYPNIPPNVSFMVPQGTQYDSSELTKLQPASQMSTHAIALGDLTSEEGYNIIAVPDIFDVDEFLAGFCFLHKQYLIANAKRESKVSGELVRASDVPRVLRTDITLLTLDVPTRLLNVYYYTNDGTIVGLNVMKKEKIDY